jgi:hypothetical protein
MEGDDAEADRWFGEQPLLAGLAGASALGRTATGPNAGRPLRRLGDRIDLTAPVEFSGPRCASLAGVTLHANVCVPARDRRRLERLCRYAARPPLCTERLSQRDDGRLEYRLRHRWRDGTTHVLFEDLELVERLAALVYPPRFHTVRYHGILAPGASCRDRVVPRPARVDDVEPRRSSSAGSARGHPAGEAADPSADRERRLTWAELMRRVFAVDVLECPRCCGRLRILAVITSLKAIRAILDCLAGGRNSRSPPEPGYGAVRP